MVDQVGQVINAKVAAEIAERLEFDFGIGSGFRSNGDTLSGLGSAQSRAILNVLTAAHDFWWPLIAPLELSRVFVAEDSLGVLSCLLARRAQEVVAVFAYDDDASLLRSKACGLDNIKILVSDDIYRSMAGQQWDLIVLQRISAKLGSWQAKELYRKALSHLSSSGSLVVADRAAPFGFGYGACKDIAKQAANVRNKALYVFVNQYEVDSGLEPLPEMNSVRAESPWAALVEGICDHKLRRGTLLRFLRAPSLLMVIAGNPMAAAAGRMFADARVRTVISSDDLTIKRLIAGNCGTTVMLAGSRRLAGSQIVLRAAVSEEGAARVRKNAAVLRSLEKTCLRAVSPKCISEIAGCGNEIISAESCLPGRPLYEIPQGEKKDALMVKAVSLIEEYRASSAAVRIITKEDFPNIVGSAFAWIKKYACSRDVKFLPELEKELRNRLVGKSWPLGPIHGDFKAGNILFSERGKISGIIDWDYWSDSSLPLMDVMTLCVYEDAREEARYIARSFTEGLLGGEWRAFYRELIASVAARQGLDERAVSTLKVVFWLTNLRDRLSWKTLCEADRARLLLQVPIEMMVNLVKSGI